MFIVTAHPRAATAHQLKTFYIETNEISHIDAMIQYRMGEWYQVLTATLVDGFCLTPENL